MENDSAQNSNLILQTLLKIQNSITKLNEDIINIRNETNKNKENIDKLKGKINNTGIESVLNKKEYIKNKLNINEEQNNLAKTQIISQTEFNLKTDKTLGLNKTQIINKNSSNKLKEQISEDNKEDEISSNIALKHERGKNRNDIKKSKNKKNKKYNKNNKSDLRKSLQFLEIIIDKQKWKYSIKFFDESKTTVYYNCIDSKCQATGIYNLNDKNIINHNNNTNGIFNLTKEHNLTFNEHNYNKIDSIKKDIEELPLSRIKKKLENYYYLYDFIKAYAILNSENNFTMISLQKEIESKYGKLNINFDTIKKDDINKKTKLYKKKHNIGDEQNIDMEKIYNINNIIRSAYNSIRILKEFKNNFNENIMNLKINEENITTKLKVNFIRKNKTFEKDIFILMTNELKNNLISEDNTQYFADCTYYAIPPNKSKYKLFLILGL